MSHRSSYWGNCPLRLEQSDIFLSTPTRLEVFLQPPVSTPVANKYNVDLKSFSDPEAIFIFCTASD